MSRIGKKPIAIPQGVKVALDGATVEGGGPQGQAEPVGPDRARCSMESQTARHRWPAARDHRNVRALHGLTRALVANMVHGVKDGFERKLEIVGIGYRVPAARARTCSSPSATRTRSSSRCPTASRPRSSGRSSITLRGADKALLGQTAAKLRALRKPDPYKGKGIKYADEAHPHEGRQEGGRQVMLTGSRRVEGRKIRHLPHPRAGARHGGAAAAGRVPEPESHLRPGGRRRRPGARWPRWTAGRRSFRRKAQAGGNVAAAKIVGELLAERAKARGIGAGRVRPRRLPVPRAREGPGRRGARRAASVLASRTTERSGGSADRSERAGAERPGGRHQPGGQGRQGRPAVLLHRAGGGGRRQGHVGVGLGKAHEVPGGDPQGGRARQEGSDPRAAQGHHDPVRDHRPLRRRRACSCKPAAQGTGVIAGGAVRPVLEAAGVQDILTKTLGTNNPHNVLKATMDAFRRLKRLQDLHAAPAPVAATATWQEAAGAKKKLKVTLVQSIIGLSARRRRRPSRRSACAGSATRSSTTTPRRSAA